ncbi:MAG: hypothetical protein U0638_01635 [Phycisphaerales bacterium]
MTAMPREILIDDQGRVMRRAEGDLATPDCPECCGETSCASAALCPTTPNYAGIHPKTIWFDCPADRRVCHDPDTPRLIEFGGYCYQPNYDQDGLLVCEPCPGDDADNLYIGDPVGQITCLAPDLTCDNSPCSSPFPDPHCCGGGLLGAPSLDCGSNSSTWCDCGRRNAFVWSGEYVSDTYNEFTGEHCSRYTKRAACLIITSHYCPDEDPCGWQVCSRRYGGMSEVREYFGSCAAPREESYRPYGPPMWPDNGPGACLAWVDVTRFFPELGDPLVECDRTINTQCNATQRGRLMTQTGTINCDGVAFAQTYQERYKGSCGISQVSATNVSGTFTRLIECEQGRGGPALPGAMELL